MKFKNDTTFQKDFEKINDIVFYPYVGKQFKHETKRIMVFAHNIYGSPETRDIQEKKKENPTTFAGAMEAYTYDQRDWTEAFRYFVKGALCLQKNYSKNSDAETINTVDEFIEKIAFVNFIQDIIISDNPIVKAAPEEINKSIKINQELLKILEPTHVICWGEQTEKYLLRMDNYSKVEKDKLGKKGFYYSKLKNKDNGKIMHVLRISHPGYPQWFHPFSPKTHEIFDWFFDKD
ncbi:MAG: hypothetical protein R6V32_02550 [Bacteroidales bacterium]